MRVTRKQVAYAATDAPTRLRTDLPVAVYYRQSGKSAVGNTSTLMQTIDMVEHLVSLGWDQESILVIDLDQGISGAVGIEKRTGLRYLWALIEHELIGTIAAIHVDRFFREIELIQANQFIDLCSIHGVHILTPTFVYEFDHPRWGVQHRQLFRLEAQNAADYLHTYVQGRLHKGQRRLQQKGLWAGGRIPVGYLVDDRKLLADGKFNPNWRKLTPFAPMSTVVMAYFEIANELADNVWATFRQIRHYGPFFPEEESTLIPLGFKHSVWPRSRSSITGGLMLSRYAMQRLLANPVYAGHWMMRGKICVANNHPAIVSEALLLCRDSLSGSGSGNRLSKAALNSAAAPTAQYIRQSSIDEPTNTVNASVPSKSAYQGVVYGETRNSGYSTNGANAAVDLSSSFSRLAEDFQVPAEVTEPPVPVELAIRWHARQRTYVYTLPKTNRERALVTPFYSLDCRLVDEQVESLMLQRLLELQRGPDHVKQRQMLALTRDSTVIADLEVKLTSLLQKYNELPEWSNGPGDLEGQPLPVENSRSMRSTLGTGSAVALATSLHCRPVDVDASRGLTPSLETSILNPLDQMFRHAEATHADFKLLTSIDEAVINWPHMQPTQRRQLFDLMAEHLVIYRPNSTQFQIAINWRDSTLSQSPLINSSARFWSPADRMQLAKLFDSKASQEDILAAFPTRTWRSIVAQFAVYRKQHSSDAGRLRYNARLPHARNTRWSALTRTHTEERCTDGKTER